MFGFIRAEETRIGAPSSKGNAALILRTFAISGDESFRRKLITRLGERTEYTVPVTRRECNLRARFIHFSGLSARSTTRAPLILERSVLFGDELFGGKWLTRFVAELLFRFDLLRGQSNGRSGLERGFRSRFVDESGTVVPQPRVASSTKIHQVYLRC